MVDIFSAFDPATNSIFNSSPQLFWSMASVAALIIHPTIWLIPSRVQRLNTSLAALIHTQAQRTFLKNLKGSTTLLASLFILIILVNFLGVLPYMFRVSSHLIFALRLGLPLWISLIISGAVTSPSSAAAGLLPAGAPAWLNPFLVLVETLRILVRPITLSFRLAANMTAGHVIISLVGTYSAYALFLGPSLSLSFLLAVQTAYSIFEFGVCLIQAYIFCLLLSLYREDHPA